MQNLVITKKGQELMAKLIAGNATAQFTKVKTSDYNYNSVILEDLTDLYQIKQSVNVSNVSRTDTTIVEVQAAINNNEVSEGYYIRAVGLYAKSSDNGEFLYAISVSEHPDYMPPFSGQTVSGVTFKLNTKVDNSEQVVIEVDPAASTTVQQLQDVIAIVTAHSNKTVQSEQGVHGFRFFNDILQFNDGSGNWIDIETGGGGIAPSNVVEPKVKIGNAKLTITWGDPGDTVVDGQTICTWKGTKLVQKVGAYPENIKDGTVLVDNQVKDTYKTNGFVINNLNNGTTYYFALFPYSDKNAVNENAANRLVGTPQPYKRMTVNIDLTNSNPATCITYADDAVGMTPGSAEWDDFFGHYPCLFKNGQEVGKLKRDNFSQFEDGRSADITSGDAGDVMIAFPRMGIKISTSGDIVTVSMTDDPDNTEFKYYAHTRGSHRKDKFYLGAYKGYYDGSKLRSLSGKTPTSNQTIGTFRGYARNNGTGYDQSAFHQLTFRQVMYLLKYKHLNSQVALGRGYVDGNSSGTSTGGTNTRGMDFGETTGKVQMKLFGLEDFWGNYYEWVDGIYSDSVRNILVGTDNFNDTGSGYTNHEQGATSDIGGWMERPQGTTETGFIAKKLNGSETTYFCDYTYLYASRFAYFGGSWGAGSYAGAFLLYFYYSADNVHSVVAGRLMYL
jgi:hypothetical protein|nr:MAG TPA: tail collar fiber protein [Caudoviricetes sp.]